MHGAAPLGHLLVTAGLLTQEALDEVLSVQRSDGRRLGELLAEKGLVRPHQLAQFLSHQLACPWVSLQRVEVTREAVDRLPRYVALKHHMVPVHLRTSKGATALYVAMDDPTDDVALAEAARAATMPVKPMIALTSEIRTLLDRLYGDGHSSHPRTPEPPSAREEDWADPNRHGPSAAPPRSMPPRGEDSGITPTNGPKIIVREEATRVPSRPPKPPPPRRSGPPQPEPKDASDEPSLLEDIEVIEEASAPPAPFGKVVVVEAEAEVLAVVTAAAAKLGAETISASLADAGRLATEFFPCIVVVTDESYETGRSDLDRIVLEAGAQLVVSSTDFQSRQLEGLLEGAIKRWRKSSYTKGASIDGRYVLQRDLGGRISGSRWEARHARTERRVILKVGVRATQDEADAEAVRREQSALSRFVHPGSVDLRDAGTTEQGDPYIVLEMLEGRTLEGLVAARGALQAQQAGALIRQIAEVLACAHEAGVLHHEVKPENVLVVRDAWGVERVKLVHWESATVAERAPETAVDLAGVGACAFLALVGRARRDGEDVQAALPPEFAKLVARAIGGASAKRFNSAKELIAALEKASAHRHDSIVLLKAGPEHRTASVPPVAAAEPVSDDATPPDGVPAIRGEELRRYPRAAYRTPVRVEVTGVGAVDGRSEDISERGLFVVTRGKIAEGAQVTVRFALPIDGKVVSEPGTVRWSREPRSPDEPRAIGIELASAGAETTKQIARYVSFMASEA